MKKSIYLKNLIACFSGLILIISFQNCAEGFKTNDLSVEVDSNELGSQLPDTEVLPTLEVVTSGEVLYNRNCMSCHGSLDPVSSLPTTKFNKTSAQIQDAIANFPAMRDLKILTPDEIERIATALVYVQPQASDTADLLSAKLPLGHRKYVASTMETIFLSPSSAQTTEDTTIQTTIKNLVTDQIAAFGGPCYRYDYFCPGGAAGGRDFDSTNHYGSMKPEGNALRSGFKIRACEEVLQVNKAVTNALTNGQLTVNSVANEDSIRALLNLFSPDQTISTVAITALINNFNNARSRGLPVLEAWRLTLLPMCTSAISERI